jgi:hypothetical protein
MISKPAVYRTRFTNCREHDVCDCDYWTYCWTPPRWPGTESPEWIEYIPEGETSC